MPVVRTMLDMQDVMPILTAKGYGVNRNRSFDLQLTVPGKRVFSNGTHEREMLKGLSRREVEAVLQRCETPTDAALMFESLSKGLATCALEDTDNAPATQGLSAEALAGIIDSRVANEVRMQMAGALAEIGSVRQEITQMVQRVQAIADGIAKSVVEKPVAKKGRKGKPSKAQIDQMLDSMNLPKEVPPIAE